MNKLWNLVITIIALYFVNMAITMIFSFYTINMNVFGPFLAWFNAIAIFFAVLPNGNNMIFS